MLNSLCVRTYDHFSYLPQFDAARQPMEARDTFRDHGGRESAREIHSPHHTTANTPRFSSYLPTISEEVTPLDHQVYLNGGTTSTLERLPSRLQRQKQRSSSIYVDDRVEELIYENSYLQAELSLHKEYRHVLLNLKSKVTFVVGMMEEVLDEADKQLRRADENYLELCGIRDQKNCGQFI